jgi:hypothetical protein
MKAHLVSLHNALAAHHWRLAKIHSDHADALESLPDPDRFDTGDLHGPAKALVPADPRMRTKAMEDELRPAGCEREQKMLVFISFFVRSGTGSCELRRCIRRAPRAERVQRRLGEL